MTGKKRGIDPKGKKLYMVLMVLSLAVFCFCLVQLFLIWKDYQAGADSYQNIEQIAMGEQAEGPLIEADTEETESSVAETDESAAETTAPVLRYTFNGDTQALKAQNPDFIGWIFVPGTAVSYPMVQAEDNDYYLRRTFEGTDNAAGCIFMDYLIEEGLDAKNPIIYGHNRRDGSMFAGLKKYEKQSFYQKYPYIHIFTTEGDRIYQIFAVYVTLPTSDTYTYGFGSEQSFMDYVAKMKSQSLYDTGVEVAPTDSILTLSTCTNRTADTRFVVQAKRIQ